MRGQTLACVTGSILVALLTDGLPGWARWVAGLAVAVGTIGGLVAGVGLGMILVFALARQTGSDCAGCGPEALVGFVALPLGFAFVSGTALGIGTTSLATWAE